jgi:hypothetical protein
MWQRPIKASKDVQRTNKDTLVRGDESPHTVQFVTVDRNVKLEVLDWGGSGRPRPTTVNEQFDTGDETGVI